MHIVAPDDAGVENVHLWLWAPAQGRGDWESYSSTCTFGIGCVGKRAGAAGLASTTAGGACGEASAAFPCTEADCCMGLAIAFSATGFSATGLSTTGFSSPARSGAAFGTGTVGGIRLASRGIVTGGRGGP